MRTRIGFTGCGSSSGIARRRGNRRISSGRASSVRTNPAAPLATPTPRNPTASHGNAPAQPSSFPSAAVSVGKDLVALLRDSLLFALALLLLFPKTFNTMLVEAGFEEGSVVGFRWKSKLVESDAALQQALTTIADLRRKNDELTNTLTEANEGLGDPLLRNRVADIERENLTLKADAERVQATVAQTLETNEAFVRKARASTNPSIATPRQRSDYLVGLQTLGIADTDRRKLNASIEADGYGLHAISSSLDRDTRPSWMAGRSTVFYYAESALPAARELANAPKQSTGSDFAVQRGGGVGVDRANET